MDTATQQILTSVSSGWSYRFAPGGGSRDGSRPDPQDGQVPLVGEELPYKVEVWDEEKTAIEQTLAMTANGSIGYAAYYEATKEFPSRYVTLRHKNRIVARWNPPGH